MKKTIAEDSKSPRIADLITKFQNSGPVYDGFDLNSENNDVRFCVWDNQHPDGKKHDIGDIEAKPFDGASDHRYRLADTIIEKLVSILTVAFVGVIPEVDAVRAVEIREAAAQSKMVRWLLKTKLRRRILDIVELSAQYMCENGWVGLHVYWDRQVKLVPYQLTVEMISRAAEMIPQFGEILMMIYDESREEEAMVAFKGHFEKFIQEKSDEIYDNEIPRLKDSALRRMVRELRKAGKTIVPVPKLVVNQPCIEVLKPWEDIFVAPGCRDIQNSICFIREFLTETALIARARAEGWSEAFLEQVKKTVGHRSFWGSEGQWVGGTDNFVDADYYDNDLIEIITAYSRRVDDMDVEGVYVTVFSALNPSGAHGEELYAIHELLDYRHGSIPVVIGSRECISKSFTRSRGIPTLVRYDQRIGKVAYDSMVDRTNVTTFPPVLTYDDTNKIRFGPASKIKVTNQNRVPSFMQIPTFDNKIMDLWKMTADASKDLFGIRTESSAPDELIAIRQRLILRFFSMWQEAFGQVFQLAKQYYSPEKYLEITGVEANSGQTDIDSGDESQFFMEFDPAGMDSDLMTSRIKAVFELAKNDVNGDIDRSKLMRLLLTKLDPSLSDVISTDNQSVSKKVMKEVRDEMNSIALGNQPELVEMDPTAGAKLQYAQQLLQSNKTFMNMQANDADYVERLGMYFKNLEHSYNQTTLNKERGRKGV